MVPKPAADCPVRPAGHWAIKLNTKRHPDRTWWCAACGAKNLPPPNRKPWE